MDSKTTVDRFVGIDVAKNSLEVHVRPDKLAFSCGTDADSLAALAQRLKALQPKLIVLEATGGYESLLAAALVHAGLTVAIVNPRQTRQFAGAVGRLAKTDKIDAAMIAHFAEAIRPRPYVLADAQTQRLAALMARRAQLMASNAAEQQRHNRASDADTRKSCVTMLRSLKLEIARIEKLIDKLITASPLFQAKQDLLRSIPGIGDVVARIHRRVAGARHRRPPSDRRPGWGGAAQPRQRSPPGRAPCLRRTTANPGTAVYRRDGSDPVQSSVEGVLRTVGGGGQKSSGRADRRDAQAGGHRQRRAARQPPLGCWQSLIWVRCSLVRLRCPFPRPGHADSHRQGVVAGSRIAEGNRTRPARSVLEPATAPGRHWAQHGRRCGYLEGAVVAR